MDYTAERDRALMSLQSRVIAPELELNQGRGYKWKPIKKTNAWDMHVTEIDVADPTDDHELMASMSIDAFLC